jgi:ATP-binding cassette subfamily B protein
LYSTIPTLLRRAIDAMEAGAPFRDILAIAGTMIALTLVMAWFRFHMREILNGVSRVIENDLRDALFTRLTALDAAWYHRTRTGEVMARLTNDLGAVRQAAGPAVMYLTNTIFGGLFAISFMIAISGRLTLIAIAPMIVLPAVTLYLGRAIHDRFERVQAHFGGITTLVQEHLSGVRIVRAYRQEGPEVERFGKLSEEYLEKNLRLVRMNGLMNPSFSFFAGLGAAAVLGFGGAMVVDGRLTVGAFVAFGLYLANLTWPLIALGWVTSLFQRGAASMTRILEILDARPDIADPSRERITELPPTAGGRSLTFEHVHFAYPPRAGDQGEQGDAAPPREILTDISVTVPAGGTLGIVGATGSGKSTLLELVPRIADVTKGRILLDGVDIRDLPLAVLRREIGFVPQESMLFSETLLSNVGYGTASDDDARWAADVAQLTETIANFPGGWETMLGERGINLSGGQKQRATMARALARKPAVVILDDALSAVDTHTEAAILRGLRGALAGRTAIIASHRITAIRDAHWIIVLDEGRLVEQGRHEALLAARGRYWELLRRQQLEDEIEDAPEEVAPA